MYLSKISIKFPYHMMYSWKTCNFAFFSFFTESRNYHHPFWNIFIFHKEILYPLTHPSFLFASQPLETLHLPSLYRFAYPADFFMNGLTHTTWSFLTGSFHLACFQDSSILQPVSLFYSFLWSYNMLWLYGQTRFCLSIHPSMDI